MVHVFELIALILVAGTTGWLTQAYVEERHGDRLP